MIHSYTKISVAVKVARLITGVPCQDRVTNISDTLIEAKRGIFGQWVIYQNKLDICGFKVFLGMNPLPHDLTKSKYGIFLMNLDNMKNQLSQKEI